MKPRAKSDVRYTEGFPVAVLRMETIETEIGLKMGMEMMGYPHPMAVIDRLRWATAPDGGLVMMPLKERSPVYLNQPLIVRNKEIEVRID